jgi:hypothetical protein
VLVAEWRGLANRCLKCDVWYRTLSLRRFETQALRRVIENYSKCTTSIGGERVAGIRWRKRMGARLDELRHLLRIRHRKEELPRPQPISANNHVQQSRLCCLYWTYWNASNQCYTKCYTKTYIHTYIHT